MTVLTASEARKNLFSLIQQVNDDVDHVIITSRRGNAVLISEQEWSSIQATMHELRSPTNAHRLRESIAQAAAGKAKVRQLVDTD